tara:strand:+ start:228 stop:410 length:183 start_codon:yes stop_codon:yes gene_type:complete
VEYLIFAVAISLCAYQSWQLGVREGAERTVKRLHQEKIISIKPNGDISPNLFWVEDKTES